MALTNTFVKQVKLVKPAGDKHNDGDGMYLPVLPSGKYWRMGYRYLELADRIRLFRRCLALTTGMHYEQISRCIVPVGGLPVVTPPHLPFHSSRKKL